MKIYSKSQLEEFKKQLPQELLTNPVFIKHFDEKIFLMESGEVSFPSLDISVSQDGKKVTILKDAKTTNDGYDNRSEISCSEIILTPNNGIETIDSWGCFHDANLYYNKPNFNRKKPSSDLQYTSVLDVEYQYSYYDEKDIELQNSTYTKQGWNITSTRYNEEEKLKAQMLKEGWHKPKKWTNLGPDIPLFCDSASVYTILRDFGHPAIAIRRTYDVEQNGNYYNPKNGQIDVMRNWGEYPDRLRMFPYPFATYENGKLVSINEHDPEIAKEALKEICLTFGDVLESSRTKKTNPIAYEELKKRQMGANQKYQKEPEEKGRTM